MRILHMIPTLTGGGAERQLGYLSRELVRRGHDVRVAYILSGVATWVNDEVLTIHLSAESAWDPRLLKQTVALLRSWRPDILQTWIVQMDVVGGLAAAATRTSWVLREPTSGVFYQRGIKAKLRLAIARTWSDAVVANSADGLAYWSQRAPWLEHRLIANAVAIDDIDGAPNTKLGPRPVGLFAGRLETLKNVDVMLAAAAEVMRDTNLEVVICGDGPDRARLEMIAQDLGHAEQVRFIGYAPDVWRYMKAAAFFVSLSDFEGCPNSVLEAFASGAPAILSDIPAHRGIADETSAVFVPVRDVPATAAAMRHTLADRTMAATRASVARSRVEKFSIGAMTDAFERLYEDVASKKPVSKVVTRLG